MQSLKVINLLVSWENLVKLAITLDLEDIEWVHDIDVNTRNNQIKTEMPLSSMMSQFFEGSNTDELIQNMFV